MVQLIYGSTCLALFSFVIPMPIHPNRNQETPAHVVENPKMQLRDMNKISRLSEKRD